MTYREIMFERGEPGQRGHCFGAKWTRKTADGWVTLTAVEQHTMSCDPLLHKQGFTRWWRRGRTRFSIAYWGRQAEEKVA